MAKIQSVRSVFFRYVAWLIVISALLSGLLKAGMEWQRSAEEFHQIRKTYMDSQKLLLKQRVEAVFRFINFQRSYSEKKIRALAAGWTAEADRLLRYFTTKNSSGVSLKSRQKQAINIIKTLDQPSGFSFTAIEVPGGRVLFSSKELSLTPRQITAVIRHASGTQFETDGIMGSAQLIPSLHLCIAILEPRARQEKWLQDLTLDYITSLRFGKEGYIFVNTFDAIPLIRDGKRIRNGKSAWNLTDPNGVKVLQEEYRAANKNGGDFIFYSWRKLTKKTVVPKMSYIRGLKDWKWIIGTGIYLDEMENAIVARRAELMHRVRWQATLSILAFLLIIGIVFLMAKRMGEKLSSEFEVFARFFRDCVTSHQAIELDSLKLVEFQELAKQANRMIASRKQTETALKKSEEKFRRLFEQSRDAMSILGRDKLIDCNRALLTLFHATDKSELLVPPWELSPEFQPDGESSKEKAKKIIRETFEGGGTRFEWMHRKLTGEDFWCEITLTRIPWEEDDCIFVVWRDITKTKEALNRLKQSEARLRKSQEMSWAGNWEVDLRNNYYVASDEAYRIYGYTAPGVITSFEDVSKAIHPDDKRRVEEEFRNFIIQGKGYDTTFRIQRFNDGEIRYVHSIAERITDKSGKAIRIVGVIQDITPLIEKEHALAKEHEKMRITLRSMASGVIVTDSEMRVELMNPVAEKLTGWRQESANGVKLNRIFQAMDTKTGAPVSFPGISDETREQNDGMYTIAVLIEKNGTEHTVLYNISPIQWKDSGILGQVLVFRDITEQLKMEQELQKTQRLESLGVLAGGIAHDFNNQMTGITGNISLVKAMAKKDPKITSLLSEAEKAANTCKALARQLLTFASGGAPITEPINPEELIRDSVSFNLRGTTVESIIRIQNELWNISADPGQFRQVMSNLLINAIQAMPKGGTIRISAENTEIKDPGGKITPGKYVHISISDTGSGIDPELQSKIFDPFFTTKKSGSGLGLSTVHSIVKRHGGHIELKSEPGKGSTFSVFLPATEKAEPKTVTSTQSSHLPPLNVLLMDDEEIIRDVGQEIFRFLGHSITTTTNGEEAVKQYREAMASGTPFDMVLLDITIPGGMGGKETIARLLQLNPEIKAVVTSGYSQDPIIANYSEYGFRGRLEKPFKIEDIEKLLQSLFR